MVANIWFLRNTFAPILIAVAIGLPVVAAADHVPDNFSKDLDPNFIACLMAIDDAEMEFRHALESACFQRMGEICSGKNGDALPSQVIDCLHFETQRGIGFLLDAVNDLPESVERGGFFGHGYQTRRDGIMHDAKELKNSPAPNSIEIAVQQVITMASAAETLFWLARETGTPIEAHVVASFGGH